MTKVLPVGAVVLLECAKDPIMIVGYLAKGIDEKERDYMGVPYPVGLISMASVKAFNHIDIKEILFEGYIDNNIFNKFIEKLAIDVNRH